MHDSTFRIGIYTITIRSEVLAILSSYKQNRIKDHEAGGTLLGYSHELDITIERVSLPNKFDRSTRYGFERNKDAAQIVIDYEFANSLGKMTYLGEWHTHPENYPSPSNQDISMIKNQYKKNKLNEPFILLLIQGIKDIYFAIYDGKDILNVNSK